MIASRKMAATSSFPSMTDAVNNNTRRTMFRFSRRFLHLSTWLWLVCVTSTSSLPPAVSHLLLLMQVKGDCSCSMSWRRYNSSMEFPLSKAAVSSLEDVTASGAVATGRTGRKQISGGSTSSSSAGDMHPESFESSDVTVTSLDESCGNNMRQWTEIND